MDKIGQIAIPHDQYISVLHSSGISGDGVNTPLGIDTSVWTPYNETLLYSGTAIVSSINLSEPTTNFRSIKIRTCNHEEHSTYYELTPTVWDSIPIPSVWGGGNTNAQAYSCWELVNNNSTLQFGGRAFSFSIGWAGNGTTASKVSHNNVVDWASCPIFEVWGINRINEV